MAPPIRSRAKEHFVPQHFKTSTDRLPAGRNSIRVPRNQRMTRVLLAGLTAAALLLTGCDEEPPGDNNPARNVRWDTARPAEPEQPRSFVGRTRAGTESRVGSRVDGHLLEVLVDVGDTVEAGEPVARIDPDPQEIQRETAETRIRSAEAQRDYAESTYERVRGLYQQDLAGRDDYEQAQAALESAEASLERARRVTELTELELSYTEVEAPYSGRVARTIMSSGENVAAGLPVVTIISEDAWEVHLTVPDRFAGNVNPGDPVDVEIDGETVDSDSIEGVVAGVSGAAQPAAGTVPVRVSLHGDTAALRSGQVAEVTFYPTGPGTGNDDTPSMDGDHHASQPLTVPATAVSQEGGQETVYLLSDDEVGEEQTVGRVTVETGTLRNDRIEIRSGLREGDPVVTLGTGRLSDGDRVIPMERSSQ